MFTGYENGCKNGMHLVNDWKTRLGHWLSCELQKKILHAPCAVRVTLSILARGTLMATSLHFSDVNK